MDNTDQQRQDLIERLRYGQEDPYNIDFGTVRYAIYARKSTSGEERQASSIEDQIRDCMEKVAIPNNLNVVKVYQESFSAKVSDVREKFNEMIHDIQMGRIDGVISWHPDRLARNMKDAGAIIELVDRMSIRDLRFPTFQFDNSPHGKMALGISFVMAKQYSEHLSESVSRGNKRATEDGEFIGKFKHGYILDSSRHFQPDPVNFIKIKKMFDMALEGASQKDVRLWINEQDYKVQKRQGYEPVPHEWTADSVSKLLRDPFYTGVLRWGKNLVNLVEEYDFEPIISVDDFLTLNKIKSLDAVKIVTVNRPKGGDIRANLLRRMVYCAPCNTPLTCMIIDKRNPETKEIISSRFYYKCETDECEMYNKAIRAGEVIAFAQKFFEQYLFTTESNYETYLDNAKKYLKKQNSKLDSEVGRLNVLIANKQQAYDRTKELIADNPDLSKHYDLDKYMQDINDMRLEYNKTVVLRRESKDSLPTYADYLKLFESAPVILGKIRDMKQMDLLLKNFFLNFTVTPTRKGSFKGSEVSCKLKEPWNGFLESGNFVLGAGEETLTLDLFLGKEAL